MNQKIRRLSTWFLVIQLLLAQCVTVFAGDCAVSYEGQAEQFIFQPGSSYSPTDLFKEFKAVMPGDKLTESIEVRNNSKNADIKVYMRAVGAHKFEDAEKTKASSDFLAQLKLSVTERGVKKLSDTSADLPGELKDWVCLGMIKKGTNVILDVTLLVPIEMGNDFEEAAGYLDWQFKVEEIPQETPPKPEDRPDPKPDQKPAKTTPTYAPVKTGDTAEIWYWGAAIVLSAAVLLGIRHRHRKTQVL